MVPNNDLLDIVDATGTTDIQYEGVTERISSFQGANHSLTLLFSLSKHFKSLVSVGSHWLNFIYLKFICERQSRCICWSSKQQQQKMYIDARKFFVSMVDSIVAEAIVWHF
jgi:hypothetical protein